MTEMKCLNEEEYRASCRRVSSLGFYGILYFLFAKFSNPIPLSSYYPLLPLCHPKLGQCLLFFGLKQKPKGKRILVAQSPETILTQATG